jgi:urease beta subunit
VKPMTASEFREAKTILGFKTQAAFGFAFRIPLRTVVRYLAGDPIPDQTAMLVRIATSRKDWKKLLIVGYGGKDV